MLTNFAALTPQQKLVWSRDVWKNARDGMFIKKFIGSDENSVIQRITELTKTEAERLAAAANALRPDWPVSSLLTYLSKHKARAYRDVAVALAWIATDPQTKNLIWVD